MAYYIDLLTKSRLFWMIVVLLFFIALVFISIVIENYIKDVFKLLLLIYLIYFPIGAFMGIYYWIITKELFSRKNNFTLGFLYCSIYIIVLIICRCLQNVTNKHNYKAKGFFSYMFESQYLEGKLTIATFGLLYVNIFFGIYTLIGFYNLVITWIK